MSQYPAPPESGASMQDMADYLMRCSIISSGMAECDWMVYDPAGTVT